MLKRDIQRQNISQLSVARFYAPREKTTIHGGMLPISHFFVPKTTNNSHRPFTLFILNKNQKYVRITI